MLTIIIPCLNAAGALPATLHALIAATVDGEIGEVVVVDGGSTDNTLAIADAMGARIVRAPKGRGVQLAAGAKIAKHPWLLFLHADTVLEPGWHHEAARFMEEAERGPDDRAAVFRFRLNDASSAARFVERGAALRYTLLGLPYGDQGLLISRAFYDSVGGFTEAPIMEDVDIVRRIGRQRLMVLQAAATTSAERYRRDGYATRVLRNAACLSLYYAGFSTDRIAKIYG